MEPVPFRGIKMVFGFGEKVLVILHGLPVLDHKLYLFVVFVLCVCGAAASSLQGARLVTGIYGHQTRPHALRYVSIVFLKI